MICVSYYQLHDQYLFNYTDNCVNYVNCGTLDFATILSGADEVEDYVKEGFDLGERKQ